MTNNKEYFRLVENAIQENPFLGKPLSLYEPANYMMSLGGKRIRPILTLMACKLFGGNINDALQPALAMEVFHNFTLVHDDIMDNAPIRRGKKTVHEKWNASTAILSGDVMLVLAYELISKINPAVLPEAIKLFNETAKRVCEGQQLDMEYQDAENITIDNYVEMIGLKTAALLAGSLKMGALVAGTSTENADLIYTFGYAAGIAFQVQDDLLDTFGDAVTFGKKIGGDIAANKKTYLAIKAMELADDADKNELKNLANGNDFFINEEEKISKVIAIYNKLGVKEITEEARDKYFRSALENLDKISADTEVKKELANLAAELVERAK